MRPLARPLCRGIQAAGPAALALLLLGIQAGCLGFDPTPPPATRLVFSLELPAAARATVRIYDDNDQVVGQTEVEGDAPAEVTLAPGRDYTSLRLVARAGERMLKVLIAAAGREEQIDLGRIDAAATARAQVIQERVAGQGGSFAAMPQAVIVSLLGQAAQGGNEVKAFAELVRTILERARTAPTAPEAAAFQDLDALLGNPFVAAHAKELPPTIAADYRNALTAAAASLEITLVCDASLVKVMFTVDVSGEALDGNGAPQLLRQPSRSGKVFLAITGEETSPVADAAGLLKSQMVPNDPDTVMFDDGTGGDEQAGDGVFTRVLVLPRGMRVKYKYTNGSAGEGWTRTEEWPGNARLLEVRDLLSRNADGSPDCLVIRRDVFGDEASNKNFVNLHSRIKGAGGTLGFEKDLGGTPASSVGEGQWVGGLPLGAVRQEPPLSPEGLPEAVENGSCTRCPAPLTLSADDDLPPELVYAEFSSTSRVKVSFSEAMEYLSASSPESYLILDGAGRALPLLGVAASGSTVTLEVAPPDFGQTYTLHLKGLKDASARGNLLPPGSALPIGRDRTAPAIISLETLPLRDYNPAALDASPDVGQVLLVTFDEEVDRASAENAANYRIQGLASDDLDVQAATLKDRHQVWLVTAAQGKRLPYQLLASGVRDVAGNALRVLDPVPFKGFALYRITFGAVPGFAFLDAQGSKRGLPPGAGLYLTGTILAVARDLAGNPIGVAGRTDVTGVPEFEMKPGAALHKGEPVYTITLLAPPGTYAWKVAHGVPGEHLDPPPTLVKVHKSLCTTADATGVNIDPATLTALPLPGSDGTPTSFLDYGKASLSASGTDAPGPFALKPGQSLPAPTVMFKRENPDEVCSLQGADLVCPAIVIGTWRDLDLYSVGGKQNDFDDGLPEVDPVRLRPDLYAPRLRDLRVRDSESLLLSFDERLQVEAAALKVSARGAKGGAPLAVAVESLGSIGSTLLPHQILLRTAKMANATAYLLTIDGLVDALGNQQLGPLEQSWVAPGAYQPFTPLADETPPKVLGVLPKTPTSLLVQFDEKIAPADGASSANFAILAAGGAPLPVLAAAVQGGGTTVLLSTGLQAPEAAYTLVARNIADLASPPNVLLEQQIPFKGFGDFTPPKVIHAAAISPTEVVIAFSEPLSPLAAAAATSYSGAGLSVVSAAFSGDAARQAAAFDPVRTTYADNVVVLQTAKMNAGQSYAITPAGVTDLAGNACPDTATVKGVAAPPKVDVVFTVAVSNSEAVAGIIPPRALDPATLLAQREGIFILGTTVSTDGLLKGPPGDPVNLQLGGFPPEGQPLTGAEPQLLDNGASPDAVGGDNVFSIRIKDVPLGTSIQWKAFAPFTVSYKNANPGDAQAAFADASPGPSVFSDGQEFPGNENAVRILGDRDGDGVVRIKNLFGDEITHKKFTGAPPFIWVVDDHAWSP